MSAQVAADLRAAAEVLKRDGWTQENLHRGIEGKVCHCADGALAVATEVHTGVRYDASTLFHYYRDRERGDVGRWSAARNAVDAYLGDSVITWNDAPGRTADEVIAALLAAADAAEADL